MLAILNGLVYTMECDSLEKLNILVDNGKIIKIGKLSEEDLKEATIIDASNKIVMPGIVDPHCHIGLHQVLVGTPGLDVNEITNPITPELKGFDAVKDNDEAFEEALRGGVTTVCTGPGSANIIGGTFTALKTYGLTVEEKVLKEEIAMKMALGENPKRCYSKTGPMTRMATAAKLREALEMAKRYKKEWDHYYEASKTDPKLHEPAYNQKWESLKRVFEGLPCKIHAHQEEDILTALRIAKEYNLNVTIEHATSGWKIPSKLKEYNASVILGPTLGEKSKYELKDKSFDAAKVMYEAGIHFSFMTDHPVTSLEYTRTQAGLFVNHGLPYIEALKALTIYAAESVNLSDRVGSLKVGKDADIVIYDGDPLLYSTKVLEVIINGCEVYKNEN